MILRSLHSQGVIHCPSWLPDNTMYLTLMGSVAYGVSSDTSDSDIYGFCIPEKHIVFPHLAGEIIGFGRQVKRFDVWQEHHIKSPDSDKTYDFSVYSIVRYFHLCMENNPNMIDSLYVPHNCVLHSTHVGNLVREHRHMFLHKGCYHKFKGYAFSQLHKINTKNPKEGSKRDALRKEFGTDTKFLYHVARLADECEQILSTGTLDLQRSKEYMKAIRRGEVSEADVRNWFAEKEKYLEKLYQESSLPYSPDENKIKALLLQCLEHHYGSLDKLGVIDQGAAVRALQSIEEIVRQCLAKT